MTALTRVDYNDLNVRQKENYNFQKVAARLADYGYNCLRLTDDWEGADCIACHVNGDTSLKVQLKGRLTVAKKYCGKNIHIAFIKDKSFYLYPHDEVLARVLDDIKDTLSWKERGSYSFLKIPKQYKDLLEPFLI